MYASRSGKNRQPKKSDKESERASSSSPEPSMIMQLQRTIGNRAVTKLLRQNFQNDEQSYAIDANQSPGTGEVMQRATIGGNRIGPYSKDAAALWEMIKEALYNRGLSPHGAKKKIIEVAKSDNDFDSAQDFVSSFINMAEEEANRVVEERRNLPKEQRTRGWTRPLKLNRPSWPDAHKSSTQQGEDIRHIVRNATLKNALMKEYLKCMEDDGSGNHASNVFKFLANNIGVEAPSNHAWEILNAIYAAVFLNPGNLFSGPSGVNRVIGLSADEIESLGIRLLTTNEAVTSEGQIESIFNHVAEIIKLQVNQTVRSAESLHRNGNLDDEGKERFLNDLQEFYSNIMDYIFNAEEEFIGMAEEGSVLFSEIGRIILELGANFGFDVPIEGVSLEHGHMEALINLEQFLAQYNGGSPEDLAEKLRNFMNLKNILFQS